MGDEMPHVCRHAGELERREKHLEELTWPSLMTSSPTANVSGAARSVVLTVACDVSWLGSSAAQEHS